MTLSTREVIEKLIKGEKLCVASGYTEHYCYYDAEFANPFRYVNVATKSNEAMHGVWSETDWEVYKEEPKWWTPKEGDSSYWINSSGCAINTSVLDKIESKKCINQGNVFKTKEEAEKEHDLRAAKYRVKKRIWELNGGEFLEFNPDLENYTFALSKDNSLGPIWFITKVCPNWQLLKSKKLIKQLIEEMEDDLLLIRGE